MLGHFNRQSTESHQNQPHSGSPPHPDRAVARLAYADALLGRFVGPRGGASIQGQLDLLGDLVGRQKQSLVEVNVALGDASPSVAQEACDRQFGKAHISGHAGEGVTKHVRRDILELGGQAESLENPDDADEMPVADLCRKDVRVLALAAGLAQQQFEGRLTNGTELGAALGRGKTHAWGFRIDPAPLERQDLHSTKPGEEHEADRRERDRAFLAGLADRLPECGDLSQ